MTTTPTADRLTLDQHVQNALAASVRRVLDRSGLPLGSVERTALLDRLLARIGAYRDEDRLTVALEVDRTRRGRIDGRSLEAVVYLLPPPGVDGPPVELVRVRARHLVDEDGAPVDARQATRDLLDQLRGVSDEDLRRLLGEQGQGEGEGDGRG